MVEKLLKLLVGEVNAQLFESVETENFETSNIETTDEESAWQFSRQGFVTLLSNPVEKFLEDTLDKRAIPY
jgi:hypothetical protein